jgi:hypothetical protein
MQNQVVKIMVLEQLGPQLYAKHLANMTQVSDVAPGPLVYIYSPHNNLLHVFHQKVGHKTFCFP